MRSYNIIYIKLYSATPDFEEEAFGSSGVEFLTAGEACEAMFWSAPDLKEGNFS